MIRSERAPPTRIRTAQQRRAMEAIDGRRRRLAELLLELQLRVRPCRIGVRVVAFGHHALDADPVDEFEARRVSSRAQDQKLRLTNRP